MSFQPFYYSPYDMYSRPHPARSPFYDPLDGVLDSETHYRRLAEEHERRAQAALALAQEERQRQATLRRLQEEASYNRHLEAFSHPPSYRPYEDGLDSFYQRPVSYEQRLRHEHERRLEEWLQRRREKEREEAELKAKQEAEKRTQDNAVRQLLSLFGLEAAAPSSPANSSARQAPVVEPNLPVATPRPQSRAVSSANAVDLGSRVRAALSGGRSEDEKSKILVDLGLAPPQPVAAPTAPKNAVPSTATAQHKPSTSPQNSSSSLPSPTPKSTRTTPFSVIESIQLKFDALRASFEFPSSVAFAPASKHCTTASVNQFENDLNILLARLDGVQSDGIESIRGARKALVTAVEAELDELERKKEEAWKAAQPRGDEVVGAAQDVSVVDTIDSTSDAEPICPPEFTADSGVPSGASPDVTEYQEPLPETPAAPVAPSEPTSVMVDVQAEPAVSTASTSPSADDESDLRGRVTVRPDPNPASESAPARPRRHRSVEIEEVPDEDSEDGKH